MNYKNTSEVVSFLNENAIVYSGNVLNEDVQMSVTSMALEKMLDLTLSKYSKVDFSDIERSRGDLTQCKFYKNLRDSIDILCDIEASTHKIPGAVICSTALNNLALLKNDFMYAFRVKNALAIMLYNTIYYSIMEATSYLIATSVNYAKNGDKFEAKAYEVNGRDVLLINQLEKFNSEVANGNVSKFILKAKEAEDEYKKAGEPVNEAAGVFGTALDVTKKIFSFFWKSGTKDAAGNVIEKGSFTAAGKGALWVAGAVAFIYVATHIIPIIKTCIYCVYTIRHKISESARLQAELLELNLEIAKENGADEETIAKQEKAIARFRAIADKFALDGDKANRDAKKDIQQDQINVDAVVI